MILSTDHVLAFLDIMPLTRGHVLVAPRRHYEMLGDMGVEAGQEVCTLHVEVNQFPSIGFDTLTLALVFQTCAIVINSSFRSASGCLSFHGS
jgi:diadenosine tetraphosphate (Ap4A) HIT family hydrolase